MSKSFPPEPALAADDVLLKRDSRSIEPCPVASNKCSVSGVILFVLSQVPHKQKCCESSIAIGQHADVTTLCGPFRPDCSCSEGGMLTVCSDGKSATSSIRLAMLGPQRPAAGKKCIR